MSFTPPVRRVRAPWPSFLTRSAQSVREILAHLNGPRTETPTPSPALVDWLRLCSERILAHQPLPPAYVEPLARVPLLRPPPAAPPTTGSEACGLCVPYRYMSPPPPSRSTGRL